MKKTIFILIFTFIGIFSSTPCFGETALTFYDTVIILPSNEFIVNSSLIKPNIVHAETSPFNYSTIKKIISGTSSSFFQK